MLHAGYNKYIYTCIQILYIMFRSSCNKETKMNIRVSKEQLNGFTLCIPFNTHVSYPHYKEMLGPLK